jgi:hypothetical protein
MSTSTERPTLPNGWEWKTDRSAQRIADLSSFYLTLSLIGEWHWTSFVHGKYLTQGTAPDASSAAAAAERAVVEFARGLIKEIEG